MIECNEKDCRYIIDIDCICGHSDPEIVFENYKSGECLSYEKDWQKEWEDEAEGI